MQRRRPPGECIPEGHGIDGIVASRMQRAHAIDDDAKHVLDRNGEVDQFDHFRLRVADRGLRRREYVRPDDDRRERAPSLPAAR